MISKLHFMTSIVDMRAPSHGDDALNYLVNYDDSVEEPDALGE